MCLHKFVKLVASSVPCKKILRWANVCFSTHSISQLCRHTTGETFPKAFAMYTIWNFECCKCARMRFNCANGLVVPRRECWSLVTKESARFDNNDSEPKSKVRLTVPKENKKFSKTHVVKSILSFPRCQKENECFWRRGRCRSRSGRIQK